MLKQRRRFVGRSYHKMTWMFVRILTKWALKEHQKFIAISMKWASIYDEAFVVAKQLRRTFYVIRWWRSSKLRRTGQGVMTKPSLQPSNFVRPFLWFVNGLRQNCDKGDKELRWSLSHSYSNFVGPFRWFVGCVRRNFDETMQFF